MEEHIILFYKYHPLSPDHDETRAYRDALHKLCSTLNLTGRILVGANLTEGINGTLAGSYENVRAFTYALLGSKDTANEAVHTFRKESKAYFAKIQQPELLMDSPQDFKWSKRQIDSEDPTFPDLNIKLVPELIGTGGLLTSIGLDETAQGYLTPQEWHEALQSIKSDTILIDCRNKKEYEIGHFDQAIDPSTTTFSQFPKWVKDHESMLHNKKVLMYCTGGIRCEKASAYIRKQVPSVKQVNHLKGGIHKYLEEFGDDNGGLWQGRNFVFDNRYATSAIETKLNKDADIVDDSKNDTISSIVATQQSCPSTLVVGTCVYCQKPYDVYSPKKCICVVCREMVLTCLDCEKDLTEFHCRNHYHLRNCYFDQLDRFSKDELQRQLDELEVIHEQIAIGRRYRQKRKTLENQIERIVVKLEDGGVVKRKSSDKLTPRKRPPPKQQCTVRQREATVEEVGLFFPCNKYRDAATGIRVPPSVYRTVQCNVKAKWCGLAVVKVLQEQFSELSDTDTLVKLLNQGQISLNDEPITLQQATDTQLKNGDIISRKIHWHEAPVIVPECLQIETVQLPTAVLKEYNLSDAVLYVCNKPSTVPVHKAGPYFSNTLVSMVEAQVGLECGSLIPLHRTDRVTSGLVLCCTSRVVARIFQKSLFANIITKVYIARVRGKFPTSRDELLTKHAEWDNERECIVVDAPIATIDPANGIRAVSTDGKPSRSLFRLVYYNADTNESVIECRPVTGRNHQLRVHLALIDFGIIGDTQYGGVPDSVVPLEYVTTDCNFSPSQMLQGGHSINLHAYKYRIGFVGGGGNKKNSNENVIAEIECAVDLPDFVDSDKVVLGEWK